MRDAEMKTRLLGVALLVCGAAVFIFALNVQHRELAYGLLTGAYLLFVLAVCTLVGRIVGASRVGPPSGD